ncbi:hypothetical protein Hanom_Chr09g00780991 [Helianthus anomalus]
MCCVEGQSMNLASVLAWSFTCTRRGGNRADLDMVAYITRIAQNLNVFDKYNPAHLHKGSSKESYNL